MDLHITTGLAFSAHAGSAKPPQLHAAMIIKGIFTIKQGGAAKGFPDPTPVCGDLHANADTTNPLIYSSDFVLYKPRTDVIAVGHAHASPGASKASWRAAISVGTFQQSTTVRAKAGSTNPIALQHRWPHVPADKHITPLEAAQLPEPELHGFGPIPAHWPQRMKLLGTFDAEYMKTNWPWFPKDFDFGYFNAAPRSQQIEGYLRGDEEVTLENMHPDHALLRTQLPGLRVRCFVHMRDAQGKLQVSEPTMRLDTLWIDADNLKLVLVWRGLTAIRTPKMREIETVQVVTEPLTSQPKPAAEYTNAPVVVTEAIDPQDAAEDEATRLKFVQLEADMEAMSLEMEASSKEIDQAEREAEKALADAIQSMPKGEALAATVPPTLTAAEALKELRASLLAAYQLDEKLDAKQAADMADADVAVFAQAEAEFAEMEASAAAFEKEMHVEAWTRDRVQAAAANNTPMTDADLSKLDLSGLDLSDQDLSGAILLDTKLDGCKLLRTKLARADLGRASLVYADITDADLNQCDLTGADLSGATLLRLSLNRTRLAGLMLIGADLRGSAGRDADFSNCNLTGANLGNTQLPNADFTQCAMDGIDLSGALLTNASFHGVSAQKANFSQANAAGMRAEENANFAGANFTGIRAPGAVLDTATLDLACFDRAVLDKAQFEGASLRGTHFDRADLSGAMFDDANLQHAVLTNANLLRTSFEGADLRDANAAGANGYEAGFWRAVGAHKAFEHTRHRQSTLLG
jgi:uncharacterized protein YjbI with pentapeptide repeats